MNLEVSQEKLDQLGIKLDEEPAEDGQATEQASVAADAAAPEAEQQAAAAATEAGVADLAASLEEIRKQLAELKPPERHPAEAEPPPDADQPKETEEQQSTRLAKELADELGEDADVVPKLAQKVVSIASKLGGQVEQLAKKQRDVDARQARLDAIETNQRFWSAVKSEHADAEDLVDTSGNTAKGKLSEWINSQPEGMRGIYGNVVSSGTAKELSALLELAKKSFAVVKSAPATTEDLLAKKAVVEKRMEELKKGKGGSISEAPPVTAPVSMADRIRAGENPVDVIDAATGGDRKKALELAKSLLRGE